MSVMKVFLGIFGVMFFILLIQILFSRNEKPKKSSVGGSSGDSGDSNGGWFSGWFDGGGCDGSDGGGCDGGGGGD